MKHPAWCWVNNKSVGNADFCLECDFYDDDRTCENEHPNQLVHRWEITENYFGFGSDSSNVWISQGFNDKKPRAWAAINSFDEADAQELTSKELAEVAEILSEIAKIIK